MNEFDYLQDMIDDIRYDYDTPIEYETGDLFDGRRFIRVFCYDDDGECSQYFEACESLTGEDSLDTNVLDGDGSLICNVDSSEALASLQEIADGYYVNTQCDEGGFVMGRHDYSRSEKASNWDWTDDVVDVQDCRDIDEDRKFDYYDMAGRRIFEQNGPEYYGIDPDDEEAKQDAISEEASNIIHLWRIRTDSKAYGYIAKWYEHIGKDMDESIRDCFYADGSLFFVTGVGYAIFSADLLGGGSDGRARSEFDEFVRNEMKG